MKKVYLFERFNKIRRDTSKKTKNAVITFLLLSLPLAFAIKGKKNEVGKEVGKESKKSAFSLYSPAKAAYVTSPKGNQNLYLEKHFDLASRVTGVKKSLLYAHAERESNFREDVKSNKDAFGIMQITYEAYCDAKKYAATRYNIDIPPWEEVRFDSKWNIFVGATKIAQLHKRFDGNAAILAYYAGAYDTKKGIEEHGLENYIARLEKSDGPWQKKAEYYKDVKSKVKKYTHLDK